MLFGIGCDLCIPCFCAQEARKFGDFLLVGVHDDATIHDLRGHGLPGAVGAGAVQSGGGALKRDASSSRALHAVLNLYERTLSLLSCKYVDEVIIGAPWEITYV